MALYGKDFEDLLKRARRLDAGALGEIHDHFYPEVYRYVFYRLGEAPVCEDITSEVFLRLLDALHKKRGPNHNLRGWLLGTASHLVSDHLRRRYRRREENLDDGSDEREQWVDEFSLEEAVENDWEGSRLHQQVRQAFRKLTPEQQHVLALRFAEERSLDETAQVIGKTVTAVKALQFRALAALRRFLSNESPARK